MARKKEREGSEEPGLAARIWDQVSTLLLAVIIALTIRIFLIEPFRIPSESLRFHSLTRKM